MGMKVKEEFVAFWEGIMEVKRLLAPVSCYGHRWQYDWHADRMGLKKNSDEAFKVLDSLLDLTREESKE